MFQESNEMFTSKKRKDKDNYFNEIAKLIADGADPSNPDGKGNTALYRALGRSKPDSLKAIIEAIEKSHGKSYLEDFLNAPPPDEGGNLLYEAARRGTPEMVKLLLDNGADPTIKGVWVNEELWSFRTVFNYFLSDEMFNKLENLQKRLEGLNESSEEYKKIANEIKNKKHPV